MEKIEKLNLPKWEKAVIKIGSAIISPQGRGCVTKHLLSIANFINESRNQGKEIIIVSSGSFSAGLNTQPNTEKKAYISIEEKQAMSAIGQPLLMQIWSQLFDFNVAQILLTYDDISNRKRFINAKNTIKELLKIGVLPIVNENDTVSTDELKIGDNDNMSAYIANLVEADLLILCSDINGLYDSDPKLNENAKRINIVKNIDNKIYSLASNTTNPNATGGMITKIESAEKATSLGINTLIINGKKANNFADLLHNKVYGTLFKKKKNTISAKKHWILHALPSMGEIFIDNGAKVALVENKKSLLPSGIIKIKGNFHRGNAVNIFVTSEGKMKKLGKGIVKYNSDDLNKIKGKNSSDIKNILGYFISPVAIKRDDMIVTFSD
ncbi:MAG: glutamate 5-kinase [Candidatus Marinimicrobia bacterium]|nr:glutamate 5-kinase [Candidatus Neomarinimicrobiota bacterium]